MRRQKNAWFMIDALIILFCLIFMYPMLIGLVNSFKPRSEIMLHPLALSLDKLSFKSYVVTFNEMKYMEMFFNSTIITMSSVVLIVLISSMAAYKLTRENTQLSGWLFRGIILFMLVPFQCTMLPLVVQMSNVGLIDTYVGAIIGYLAYQCPFSVFMYHAYMRSIPIVLDESAKIDGCSSLRAFFTIIFPLAMPMTATLIILDVLWIWNDYLFPFIMLPSVSKQTLVTGLVGYTVMRMQRHIIKGMVMGALKE